MSKRRNIGIAILLISAGIVIHFLSGRTDGSVDLEITGLFSGICFGAGLAVLFQSLFPKKKRSENTSDN
mgnify:CR=1 FL=1